MKVDLKGKTAVITGAGGAIGSAMAMEFAQNGANVVVADLREDTMMATVEEIRKAGGSAVGIGVDVANRESAFEMITVRRGLWPRGLPGKQCGINGSPNIVPFHEYK